ncbi:MAG: aldo/keto reductase [Eubacteriales bacterium]|nr:aldo/keto reductase [Eubacteriales bacterium]
MEYCTLGNTNIRVSKLCFGSLTVGPLQANLPAEEGGRIIAEGLKSGINFIDAAELYGTYRHIREAIRISQTNPIIASKSYAYSRQQAIDSLEKARKECDRDVIDIFMLHEQETRLTLRGHRDALEYYMEAKAKGLIRAVGVSTHNVEVAEAVAIMPEIEVIHPLINYKGLGIGDGTIEEMLAAVRKCYEAGKGVYAMKPLGGGNFIGDFHNSLKFVMDLPFLHSIAMGMQSVEEVNMNVCIFEGRPVESCITEILGKKRRKLHIDYWCRGCGSCVERCRQKALVLKEGKAVVNENCVLCGYCAAVCPEFAIKVV